MSNARVATPSDLDVLRTMARDRTQRRDPMLCELAEAYRTRLPPHKGELRAPGDIKRVTDLNQIREHQTTLYFNALKKAFEAGQDPALIDLRAYDVGVFIQNAFYYVTMDPVLFAGREPGTSSPGLYIQVHYSGTLSGQRSTYIMPITQNGRVVMNLVNRYNIDQLCIECPGTVTREGETRDAAIERLVEREKLARKALKTELIGSFAAERGLLGDHVDCLAVIVGEQLKMPSDPIYANTVELDFNAFIQLMKSGRWEHPETGHVYLATDDYLRNVVLAGFLSGTFSRLAQSYPSLRSWGPALLGKMMEDWFASLQGKQHDSPPQL